MTPRPCKLVPAPTYAEWANRDAQRRRAEKREKLLKNRQYDFLLMDAAFLAHYMKSLRYPRNYPL